MKELPELVRNNPDVTFIQIFVEESRNKTESNDAEIANTFTAVVSVFYSGRD